MAAINDTAPTPTTYTEAEERDGFVEYCKLRTCQRMQVDRVDGKRQREDAVRPGSTRFPLSEPTECLQAY